MNLFICFQNAQEIDCDPEIMKSTIDTMYISLVDLAMKRYDRIHDNIRNLHYKIVSHMEDGF